MGYRWQRWERDPEYWEDVSTDEHTQRVALKASPLSWLNVSTAYSQTFRTGSICSTKQNPRTLNKSFTKFGLADRTRNRMDLTQSSFVKKTE